MKWKLGFGFRRTSDCRSFCLASSECVHVPKDFQRYMYAFNCSDRTHLGKTLETESLGTITFRIRKKLLLKYCSKCTMQNWTSMNKWGDTMRFPWMFIPSIGYRWKSTSSTKTVDVVRRRDRLLTYSTFLHPLSGLCRNSKVSVIIREEDRPVWIPC